MASKDSDRLWNKLEGGVVPAMATPIRHDDHGVDVERVGPLVDFLIGHGVAGLFVGGTTGEGILLEEAERMRLHAASVEAARGRVPVLVHVGDNTTERSVRLTRHAQEILADAVVGVTPTFYPIPDAAMVEHYAAVGRASSLPLLAYDIPQMAVNSISTAALGRMVDTIPTFAGLKSSRSDANQLLQLIRTLPREKGLLAGFEPTALGSLALGARGLVSGLATAVPEPVVALARAVAREDLDAARLHQEVVNRLLELVASNERIGAFKAVLRARGVDVGDPVPPRPKGQASLWALMEKVLAAGPESSGAPTPKARA